MSEDGGSPRPVDPNAMDVDSVNSPPAVSPQTGKWQIVNFSHFSSICVDLQILVKDE